MHFSKFFLKFLNKWSRRESPRIQCHTYLKISRLAEDQDLNQGALAALIGVSSNTMTARLKGTQPWRSDEIVIICRALHIPQEKIGEYFFPAIAKEEKTA